MNTEKQDQIYLEALMADVEVFRKLAGSDRRIVLPFASALSAEDGALIGRAVRLASGKASVPDAGLLGEARLHSILSLAGGFQPGEQENIIPFRPLRADKSVFPGQSDLSGEGPSALWEVFADDADQIMSSTIRSYSETLLATMQRYMSCLPAEDGPECDVSLYDHARMAAAAAVCFYRQDSPGRPEEDYFTLIGGDVSGIQSYLYEISSKYAGKNLKGRSFYLHILTDSIVRFILKKLNLYNANVIYNSGGSFYLLAPGGEDVQEILRRAVSEIEVRMYRHHGTSLYVAVDSVPLPHATLTGEGEPLGTIWDRLFARREARKQSRYADLIPEHFNEFFSPSRVLSGMETRDSITGEAFSAGEHPVRIGELTLRPDSAAQIKMGRALRKTRHIVISDGGRYDWEDKALAVIEPADMGFRYSLMNDISDIFHDGALEGHIDVVSFNDAVPLRSFGGDISSTLEFYGGNEVDDRLLRTFEEMCDDNGFQRMGVLRMDVDNLGKLFQTGIPGERASLARYASLSRSLDFFFSGYINSLWREVSPEQTFIIYSGGDDLFIVGDWKATIRLAERIREDFKAFVCGNGNLSISGGIAILSPKYPVMKGAEESAIEEDAAKGHLCRSREKDSLSIMDFPMNWETEYPRIRDMKDRIVTLIKEGALPKSFISKLMRHYQMADIKDGSIRNNRTYWLLTYDLTRMKARLGGRDLNTLIDTCIADVCTPGIRLLGGLPIETDYHPLELWATAARWAELETRKESDNQ